MSGIAAHVSGPPSLKSRVRRAEQPAKLRAILLVAPLLLFLLVNFVAPIAATLLRSVQEPELDRVLPRTAAAIRLWDGRGLPDESVTAPFVEELAQARQSETLSIVANRLNYDVNGFRSLIFNTARRLPSSAPGPALERLISVDPRWGERRSWAVLRHAAGPYGSFYLLAALDRRLDEADRLQPTPPEQAIFIDVFQRTFWISFVVTAFCLALGYPVAYLLASLPTRTSNLLMIIVLLPFWTSVLVRTAAWVVLLQREGIINGMLVRLGLLDAPVQLVYNRIGVYVAMTYVLLPFMVLPLYGVMKGIPPTTMRAALSLGARPMAAFWRVYLPQSLPGITAGTLLVFISAIGYYVTPAMVGGANDQMIAYFIAFYTNQTLNWGMASALSFILLAATLVLYLLYNRLVGGKSLAWR
jgi:putative spermidine/putrescine transport system permease protein